MPATCGWDIIVNHRCPITMITSMKEILLSLRPDYVHQFRDKPKLDELLGRQPRKGPSISKRVAAGDLVSPQKPKLPRSTFTSIRETPITTLPAPHDNDGTPAPPPFYKTCHQVRRPRRLASSYCHGVRRYHEDMPDGVYLFFYFAFITDTFTSYVSLGYVYFSLFDTYAFTLEHVTTVYWKRRKGNSVYCEYSGGVLYSASGKASSPPSSS